MEDTKDKQNFHPVDWELLSDPHLLVKRTERGWAGHYICSDQCMYRRNTLLEFRDIKIVVSTVGNQYVNRKLQMIGAGRYYETMAFHSEKEDTLYHDADVSRQVYFDSNWAIDKMYDGVDNDADKMHEEVVKEIRLKLLKGEKFETDEDGK